MSPPVELTESVTLCDARARLLPAARGWARRPMFRGVVPGPFLRRKRWNFVFVSHPDVLVAAALSNADYAGLAFLWLYDLKRRRFLEVEHLSPLGYAVSIGESVDKPARYAARALTYEWQPRGEGLDVHVVAPRMKGSDEPLELRLHIPSLTADESFNLIVPWSEKRWNYTGKIVALPAEGELSAGGERYRFGKDETVASIDCTRGIWPYHTVWRWSCGAGLIESPGTGRRRVGLNFGEGWTDGTGVVENALYIDGKVMPLWEPVEFRFDAENLKQPWQLRTPDSRRVALTFTPTYERAQDTNLGLIRIRLQQVMGLISGQLTLDSGEVVEISGMPGIAENHSARW